MLQARARLLSICGVALLLALGLRAVERNANWKNDETLFYTDLRTYPNNAHMNNSYAQILIWRANRVSTEINARVAEVKQAEQAGDAVAQQRLAAQVVGLRAGQERLLTEAEEVLGRALAVEARFPDAIKQMGMIAMLRGERERAIEYFENALLLNPIDKATQRFLARLRGDALGGEQRVAELRGMIEEQPDDPELRWQLGHLLMNLGRPYEALEHAAEAARLAPERTEVLRTYAEVLLLNRQPEEAIAVYQRLLALDPRDWQVHTNLVNLLSDRDPAATLHHARIAHDLRPDDLRTRMNLAEAYTLNDQVDEALRRLREIARDLPADNSHRRLITDRIEELERR